MYMKIIILSIILASCCHGIAKANTLSAAASSSQTTEYANVKISPNGDYLSAITQHEGKSALLILDVETKKLIHAVILPNDAQVGDYVWANDERLVFQKQYLKSWKDLPQYYGELMAINANGSQVTYLFGYNSEEQQTGHHIKQNTPINASALILDPLIDDDRHILVNSIPWNNSNDLKLGSSQNVYRIDVYRGIRKQLMNSPIGHTRFMTDHDGKVRFATGEDENRNTKVFYRQQGEWLDSSELKLAFNDFSPISFADTPNSIYATGRDAEQALSVYKIDLQSGEKQKISQVTQAAPANYWIHSQTKKLYAVEFDGDEPSFTFVEQEASHSQQLKQLLASFPGLKVNIVSETRDGSKMVVVASDVHNLGDYYIFDTEKPALKYLASVKKWQEPAEMALVKP
jgi:hypothetical protein